MSILSFSDLAKKSNTDRRTYTKISGNAGDQIAVIVLSMHPHAEGDGYGIKCHVPNDETVTGFINIFEDQLVLEGPKGGIIVSDVVDEYIEAGKPMACRLTKKAGQLRMVKGLRYQA